MGSKFFREHIQQAEKRNILTRQKRLIEENFNFLTCRIDGNILICEGKIQAPDYKNVYEFEIRCVAGLEPKCTIIAPEDIIPCSNIHMYQDHSLCLHYPKDMRWHGRVAIYAFTIPWLVEWVHYYEIYLINGYKWEGPESPVHFTQDDINIGEDD